MNPKFGCSGPPWVDRFFVIKTAKPSEEQLVVSQKWNTHVRLPRDQYSAHFTGVLSTKNEKNKSSSLLDCVPQSWVRFPCKWVPWVRHDQSIMDLDLKRRFSVKELISIKPEQAVGWVDLVLWPGKLRIGRRCTTPVSHIQYISKNKNLFTSMG